jgi:hypothetical protein
MDAIDFEKIAHFTFGVQRLKGLVSAISQWMEGGEAHESGDPPARTEPAAVASAYFEARHTDEAFKLDYIGVLAAIRKLEQDHAISLAHQFQGDIAPQLAETQHVLDAFSSMIEKLGYPGAQLDAQSLRGEAKKCLALRLGK